MKNPEIRPATDEDVVAFYGSPKGETMRAWVAVLDGEPIGIAGVVRKCGVLVLFSEAKPEMRKYPKLILQSGKKLVELFGGLPIRAVADPSIPSSGKYLERLGLAYLGTCSDGDVYEMGADKCGSQ